MELHQIRYFLEAAETMNFTRASEHCNVSQPALTRAIQKLEEELGGLLFRRERNKTHLTDLGKVMQQYLSKVYASTKEAELAAQQVLNLEKARLNLGIVSTIDPRYVVSFLSDFRMEYPGIGVSLIHLDAEDMNEKLLSGEVDCALLGADVPLKERLDVMSLYKENLVLAFPKGHRFEKFDVIPLKELSGESFLDPISSELREAIWAFFKSKNVKFNIFYRSDREDWIQSMVLAHMGISLVTENSILLEGLNSRPVEDMSLSRTIELVTVAGRRRSAALEAFLNLIEKHSWNNNETKTR